MVFLSVGQPRRGGIYPPSGAFRQRIKVFADGALRLLVQKKDGGEKIAAVRKNNGPENQSFIETLRFSV